MKTQARFQKNSKKHQTQLELLQFKSCVFIPKMCRRLYFSVNHNTLQALWHSNSSWVGLSKNCPKMLWFLEEEVKVKTTNPSIQKCSSLFGTPNLSMKSWSIARPSPVRSYDLMWQCMKRCTWSKSLLNFNTETEIEHLCFHVHTCFVRQSIRRERNLSLRP